MHYTQFYIWLVSMLGLFIWNRAENRADIRNMDANLESNRNLIFAIHEEIKDFHGRLCAIEEKNKGKNQ